MDVRFLSNQHTPGKSMMYPGVPRATGNWNCAHPLSYRVHTLVGRSCVCHYISKCPLPHIRKRVPYS